MIEGRENEDIIDGDTSLNVRISVRVDPSDPSTEVGSTDLLEHPYQAGNTHTLQQDLMAGNVTIGTGPAANILDPGNLVAVREIKTPTGQLLGASPALGLVNNCPAPQLTTATPASRIVTVGTASNCDTAVYSAPSPGYRLDFNFAGPGSIRVVDVASEAGIAGGDPFPGGDGLDTLWNIDNLRFCQTNDAVTKLCNSYRDVVIPNAPTLTSATAGSASGSAVVNFTAGPANGATVTRFRVDALRADGTVAASGFVAATGYHGDGHWVDQRHRLHLPGDGPHRPVHGHRCVGPRRGEPAVQRVGHGDPSAPPAPGRRLVDSGRAAAPASRRTPTSW